MERTQNSRVKDIESVAREAYMWGWPLVNTADKAALAYHLTELFDANPLLVGGMPIAYQRIAMLTGYMNPRERAICCPNQDTVYGAGVFQLDETSIVFQIPEFGDRFWMYALYDARTDEFSKLGKPYGTQPGFYLMVGPNWNSVIPDGIDRNNVVHSRTSLAFAIPRIYTDGTSSDLNKVRKLIRPIDFYPSEEFTGEQKLHDWDDIPKVNLPFGKLRRHERRYVNPQTFFNMSQLGAVMASVPQMSPEQALYTRINRLLQAAAGDSDLMTQLRAIAQTAEQDMIAPLMQWRLNGDPVGNGWNSCKDAAKWCIDYKNRTATAKSNIFENLAQETKYYYRDNDSQDEPLNGRFTYEITFPAGKLPPVEGFWSLTLYNEFHFFHRNRWKRYSLGTKDMKSLKKNKDGSLTLYAGKRPAVGNASNWLPGPRLLPFSLYLRAYGPGPTILDGTWVPPQVVLSH